MPVMKGRSASVAGRISGVDMAVRLEASRRCWKASPSLRAKRSNPECARGDSLDCFVASLLAMTSVLGAKNKSPGRWAGARCCLGLSRRSVALSEELQQQREQVDEVQVERQGAGDGCALRHVSARLGV